MTKKIKTRFWIGRVITRTEQKRGAAKKPRARFKKTEAKHKRYRKLQKFIDWLKSQPVDSGE